MIRKMLLVGCKVGPWVPLHGIDKPHFRVQPEGSKVSLDFRDGFIRAVAECDDVEGLLVEVIG